MKSNLSLTSKNIVVLGSKKGSKLPDIKADFVLTANAAVELAIPYREKYGSKIIALVNSSEVHWDHIRKALKKTIPDEIVIVGEYVLNPHFFVREELGLKNVSIRTINFKERHNLMKKALGWRFLLALIHRSKTRGIKSTIKHTIPDLLRKRTYNWISRSTGVNAIFYALARFPGASQVVISGIGLQAGEHFHGLKFPSKPALVDRIIFKYWSAGRRSQLSTTDEMLARLGEVAMWGGDNFL